MDKFLLLSPSQWQALGSIGTLLAVIAALLIAVFQDTMRSWIRRPKLNIAVEMEPPSCDKALFAGGPRPAQCYYFRAMISNKGNTPATNVQVLAADLCSKRASGSYGREPRFIPMRLKWTSTGVTSRSISPGLFAYVDLFHVIDPVERVNIPGEEFMVSFAEVFFHHDLRSESILSFDTEVKPLTSNHLMPAGIYRLTVVVGSDNSPTIRKDIDIELGKDWTANRDEMLRTRVKVSLST